MNNAMNDREKLEQRRTPKRFYFITALIFLPVFLALAVSRAHWLSWVWVGLAFAVLLWMRSKLLWQGLRMVACFALVYLVALGGLYAGRPQKNISLPAQFGRELIRLFSRLPADTLTLGGQMLGETTAWRVPDGYDFQVAALSQSRLELYQAQESESEYAILQLHGGAFMSGLNDVYRLFAERYSAMIQGGLVATLDYRLWPDYGYPSQQEDTLEAWRYLTEEKGYAPEKIILAGDSAGGNLVLSLCLRLRDEGKPLPLALVCMSPWADLSNSGPSHIFNATLDPSFGVSPEGYEGEPVGVVTGYENALNAKNPYVSPSFGNYEGFPKMLLQASDNEVLLSDSQMVYDNATAHGVDCTLTIYEDLFHVFQASLDLMPESKAAWEEISAFLQGAMDAAQAQAQ